MFTDVLSCSADNCIEPLAKSKTHPRKYCSSKCGQYARKQAKSNRPFTKVCAIEACDSIFEVNRRGGERIYCSDKCVSRAKREQGNVRWGADYRTNLNLMHKYNITIEQRDEMRAEQDYRCAICNRHEDEVSTLCVDHDHSNGRIRAMLCRSCNISLGGFYDSVERLTNAIAYLETHAAGDEAC